MKKNILLLISLFIILLVNIKTVEGQNITVDPNYYDRVTANYTTPQAWAFRHYGDVNTNLYTGTMTQEIPIYTIKDEDFNLPISLRYISDAFKPAKHSELCGYNWYINAGGCITREVRGFPDEEVYNRHLMQSSIQLYCPRIGYLSYVRNEKQIKPQNNFSNFAQFTVKQASSSNLAVLNTWLFYPLLSEKHENRFCIVDYMPDIYHFNFCDYHGTFTIDYKGDPIIIDGDFVKIDISNLESNSILCDGKTHLANLRYMKSMCPKPTTITITTNDGYKYVFGGNNAALEYNFNVSFFLQAQWDRTISVGSTDIPPITSWYLTSITAPNDRKIEFKYKKRNDRTWQFDEQFSLIDCRYNKRQILPETKLYNYDYKFMSLSATKMAILEEISVENLQIKFMYSECKFPLYPRFQIVNGKHVINDIFNAYSALIEGEKYLDISQYNNSKEDYEVVTGENYPYQLTDIKVLYNDNSIKDCHVSYKNYTSQDMSEYVGKLNSWSFLEQVNVNGEVYKMEYDINDDPLQVNIGYYPTDVDGGRTQSPRKMWLTDQDNRGYVSTKSQETYSCFGTLKKISFPTGGYQIFDYGKQHIYDFSYNYQYKVAKINGNLDDFIPGGPSSGWLNAHTYAQGHVIVYPYNYDDKFKLNYKSGGYITGAPILKILTYDKNNHILQKKEIKYYGGIYYDNLVYVKCGNMTYLTTREYTHYKQLFSDIGYLNINVITTDYGKDNNTTYTENLSFLSDNYYMSTVSNYNKWYTTPPVYLVKITHEQLEDFPLFELNTSGDGGISTHRIRYIYEGHYDAVDINKSHFNAIFFDEPQVSSYGGRLQRRTIMTNKHIKEENYTWEGINVSPETLFVYNWDVFQSMGRLYLVNPIVLKQQKTTEYAPDGKSITTTTNYSYDDKHRIKELTTSTNNQALTKQFTYPDQIPIYSSTTKPKGLAYLLNNNIINRPIETITCSNGKIIEAKLNEFHAESSDKNTRKTICEYNLHLNEPIEKDKFSSVFCVPEYHKDSRYKKIATYEFDQNNRLIKITPTGQIPTFLTWQNNYLSQTQTGNLITKYTYLPFIGISSITDERGIITYYAYDNIGRLKEIYQIKNGKKQILQAYSYHYNNQ